MMDIPRKKRETKKDIEKRRQELFWECENLEKFKRENEPKIGALLVDLFEARKKIEELEEEREKADVSIHLLKGEIKDLNVLLARLGVGGAVGIKTPSTGINNERSPLPTLSQKTWDTNCSF
jgi:hypothetical protein